MAFPNGLVSQAPDNVVDMILWHKSDIVGARTVRTQFLSFSVFQGRWYGWFLNGVLREVKFADVDQITTFIQPLDIGDTAATVWIEDFGDWPAAPIGSIPDSRALDNEDTLSNRLSFTWRSPAIFTQANKYISDVRGDSQLTVITASGMERFTNVAQISFQPTRGLLSYTIADASGTYTVEFLKGTEVVAQGTRVGDGAIVCNPVNNSGLTINAVITFTGEVAADTAFIALKWPETYQVHFSKDPLIFPRVSELVALDIGGDNFAARTGVIAADTYNAAVVPVLDGVPQLAGIITIGSLVLNDLPIAPTITGATGTAAATTISWSLNGESGATYEVFYSKIDEPINFGAFVTPAPITTAIDATSQVLLAIAGPPGLVRVVVRATKAGIEERNDIEFVIEYDAAGAIVGIRPNRASISKISKSGLALTVEGTVLSSESNIPATVLELFVVPLASSIDFLVPQATGALAAAINGVQRKEVSFTVGADGWYRVAVRAKSALGVQNALFNERLIHLSDDAPTAGVDDLEVLTIRGRR